MKERGHLQVRYTTRDIGPDEIGDEIKYWQDKIGYEASNTFDPFTQEYVIIFNLDKPYERKNTLAGGES